MRSLPERVLLCVFLGVIAGALGAMFLDGKSSDAAFDSATNLGWFPDTLLDGGDTKAVLEYRRDTIAAAIGEWRATVVRTGHADAFQLDHGPLGEGAPSFEGKDGGRSR